VEHAATVGKAVGFLAGRSTYKGITHKVEIRGRQIDEATNDPKEIETILENIRIT
jgi:hypothetical protein